MLNLLMRRNLKMIITCQSGKALVRAHGDLQRRQVAQKVGEEITISYRMKLRECLIFRCCPSSMIWKEILSRLSEGRTSLLHLWRKRSSSQKRLVHLPLWFRKQWNPKTSLYFPWEGTTLLATSSRLLNLPKTSSSSRRGKPLTKSIAKPPTRGIPPTRERSLPLKLISTSILRDKIRSKVKISSKCRDNQTGRCRKKMTSKAKLNKWSRIYTLKSKTLAKITTIINQKWSKTL